MAAHFLCSPSDLTPINAYNTRIDKRRLPKLPPRPRLRPTPHTVITKHEPEVNISCSERRTKRFLKRGAYRYDDPFRFVHVLVFHAQPLLVKNMTTSCLLLPHGAYSLLAAVLTTMGWVAALFEDSCNYALVSGNVVKDIDERDPPYLEVGLQAYRAPTVNADTGEWEFVHTGSCLAYPDTVPMDASWKFAKGFTFLALVLGGGATFYLWISTCCRFSRGSWRWAGYEVAAACLFQALSFVWFHTEICHGENNCTLFYGSKGDIMAASCWFVAALLIFGHYPVPKELIDRDGIMNNSNGTRSSNGSTSSSQRRRRSPRPVESIDDLSQTEISISPQVQDEEMAAGQDSQQEGSQHDERHKDLNLAEVELT
jgi:hypothetical protein